MMARSYPTTVSLQSTTRWHHAIDPQRRFIRGRAYAWIKRAIDLFICLLCLPFVLLLLGLLALLIRRDSLGPILFCQMRTGKHGRRFRMYKLRTMVSDAELLKLDCAHLNQRAWPDFKIADDPRVTRIGRILRKTSLDELPQLFNVLKRDMSIVGPRPTSFPPETYKSWQTARLDVLPGITGLWQISGRGRLEFDQRVRLDLEYIERQCLWLDLQIMLRTCGQLFAGEGAC